VGGGVETRVRRLFEAATVTCEDRQMRNFCFHLFSFTNTRLFSNGSADFGGGGKHFRGISAEHLCAHTLRVQTLCAHSDVCHQKNNTLSGYQQSIAPVFMVDRCIKVLVLQRGASRRDCMCVCVCVCVCCRQFTGPTSFGHMRDPPVRQECARIEYVHIVYVHVEYAHITSCPLVFSHLLLLRYLAG